MQYVCTYIGSIIFFILLANAIITRIFKETSEDNPLPHVIQKKIGCAYISNYWVYLQYIQIVFRDGLGIMPAHTHLQIPYILNLVVHKMNL